MNRSTRQFHIKPTSAATLHTTNNLMQSALWARAKQRLGVPTRTFSVTYKDRCADAVFDLLVLRQALSDGQIAYVPWAPGLVVNEEAQGTFLEDLAETMAAQLKSSTIVIRFDLPWPSPWHEEARERYSSGRTKGANVLPDMRPAVRARELRMNFGTRTHNIRKAPTNVQPADTLVLNVDRPDHALLANMHPKTRYNVRLSYRRGVATRLKPLDDLNIWYAMYTRTMRRNGTRVHRYEFFSDLIDAYRMLKPVYAHMGTSLYLLVAELSGQPLAGMILACQDRYALYLYGASADMLRDAMAPHQLQWEAIRFARSRGCVWYDMFGIPSDTSVAHPMHGLLRFKRGFGGTHIARLGCWDFPLDRTAYEQLSVMQRTDTGYHGNRC